MTISSPPRSQSYPLNHIHSERSVLKDLQHQVAAQKLLINEQMLIRFYVTLKSCSRVLLVGPELSGKLALVESLGQTITDDPSWQCQMMVGHARWASRSHNVTQLVKAQTSLNTHTLTTLVEEATRLENAKRPFIACLARISPAEIHSLFVVPGLSPFQDCESIPFPPNLHLIGTFDSAHFRWWTPELLLHTAVILWPEKTSVPLPQPLEPPICSEFAGATFLQACIRHEQTAYTRLVRLLGHQQPLQPLIEVITVLHEHDIYVPREAINQTIIFLANAWTQEGEGLFAPTTHENLNMSLDIALTQYVMPWVVTADYVNSRLLDQLSPLLINRFNQASNFLRTFEQ